MQWAIAHEIGEHYAHCAFERLGIVPAEVPANSREQIANALAARILLPSELFFVDAIELSWHLVALKRRYSTASNELIARRMLDGEPSIFVTIFDNGKLTTRQANLGHPVHPLSKLEWRCVRESRESE